VKYIADEFADKAQLEVDRAEWAVEVPKAIPRQHNGCDCGVFALAYAEHAARDAPLAFHQDDMEDMRWVCAGAGRRSEGRQSLVRLDMLKL
jgi:sentrin-specific protease 1